jgi:PleD family two-component response regulator
VVLVQADRATAEGKAAALAQAIEAVGNGLKVSYGVRELDPDTDPEALISDADAAMFAAKRVRKAG